jgi:predicted DNA-binding protein
MTRDKMIRKQVYLGASQEERIKILSSRKGMSEAEIIREAVEEYLAHENTLDPIENLIGIIHSKQGDGATEHDRDLLEAMDED